MDRDIIRYISFSVLGCSKDMCKSSDFLQTTTDKGMLSSHMMLTSGCGSNDCPWIVQALPGQKINLTLVDFWPRKNLLNLDHKNFPRPVCNRYAAITEKGHVSKDITGCGNEYQRIVPIYLSETNRVEVVLFSSMAEETSKIDSSIDRPKSKSVKRPWIFSHS